MLLTSKNPHGGDIYKNQVLYDFSANVSPLGTPKEVQVAVQAAASQLTAYPDPYCTELRYAISQKEGIAPEFILCGNGAADLIYSFALALKPKNAWIVAPTFCEYENSLRAIGCNVHYARLDAKDGFALPEWKEEKMELYDVIFICNPNNPTGKAYEKEKIKQIADTCYKMGKMLFIDECFCDLTDTPEKYSLKDEIGKNPCLFILKAFTKSYGMAGLRLGYGFCSNQTQLEQMTGVTQTWNVSTVAQKAGIAALECTAFLQKNRELIQKQREYLYHSLLQMGLRVFASDTNFLLFQSKKELARSLLKRQILIRTCGNFYGLDDTFYRCAVKTQEANTALLDALEEIING